MKFNILTGFLILATFGQMAHAKGSCRSLLWPPELAAAWKVARDAQSPLEFQIVLSEFLEVAQRQMQSYGYETSEIAPLEDGVTHAFEIYKAPSHTLVASELAKIHAQNRMLKIGGADLGSWVKNKQTLFVSPFHAFLGRDIYSTHLRHEMLHAEFTRQRELGISSPYDAEIQTADGRSGTVTRVEKYPSYLSLEEWATITQDIQLLKEGVPHLETITESKTVEDIIAAKQKTLSEVNDEIRAVLKSKFLKTEFKIDDGIARADLYYQAFTGRPAVFRVWLPELGVPMQTLPPEALLREALLNKLELITEMVPDGPRTTKFL